jgi:hypothetical protein
MQIRFLKVAEKIRSNCHWIYMVALLLIGRLPVVQVSRYQLIQKK